MFDLRVDLRSPLSCFQLLVWFTVFLTICYNSSTIIQFWCCTAPREMPFPTAVVFPAKARHTATLIFLHGLGDTGHGWSDILGQIVSPHVKLVCPTASLMEVTVNHGMKMPSWFDIKSLHFNPLSPPPEDAEGMKTSSDYLDSLVEKEVKMLKELNIPDPLKRIVIGGFSQGGAVSLYNMLTTGKHYAGFLGLSTWLPTAVHSKVSSATNTEINVFQGHGEMDPLVPYQYGTMTNEILKTCYRKNKFTRYAGMGHSSCDQEMEDVKTWLHEVLPKLD